MVYNSYEDMDDDCNITNSDIIHAMEPIFHPDEDDDYYMDNDLTCN